MSTLQLESAANRRLDEIYDFTADRWGEEQADRYVKGLFAEFAAIAKRRVPWRPLPAVLGIEGYSRSCQAHVIYWRAGPAGEVSSCPCCISGWTRRNV